MRCSIAGPELLDWCAGGAAAGVAIAIKPATSLFLAGPALAAIAGRRARGLAAFVGGISPAIVALTVWKARGLGHIPLLSSESRDHVHGVASAAPLAFINISRYTHDLSWARLTNNIDLLREHFWSGRLIVWLVLAGLIGLGRRSRAALLLVGGSFLPFALIKGSYTNTSVEDASVFRVLMPCYPLFVVLLASLPLLLPHMPGKLRDWRPAFTRPSRRSRIGVVTAAVVLSAAVPIIAFAAASVESGSRVGVVASTSMPVPTDVDLGLTASVEHRRVVLRWRGGRPLGGAVFYRISRDRSAAPACAGSSGAPTCTVTLTEVGVSRSPEFVDRPQPGRWFYRVAIAANWLNDPGYGDRYLVSRPLAVHVP